MNSAKAQRMGVIYVILSAVFFGMMPLLARIAYAHGSNAYTVAFARFFVGGLILGAIIVFTPGLSLRISGRQLYSLMVLSVPYVLVPVMLYGSYNYIDSGLATTLHFTYPIVVMVIMVLFCETRLDTKQIVCGALCVGGIALMYTPDGQISVPGIALAAGSGIVYAVYIVLLARSPARELPVLVLTFWLSMISAAGIGVIALCGGNLVLRLDGSGWLAQAGMAVVATVFAVVLFQKGLFLCGEIKASLFSTFEPVTGIVIGLAVFHETLSMREVLGVVGILTAVVLLVTPAQGRRPWGKCIKK